MPTRDKVILEQACDQLRSLLGPSWKVSAEATAGARLNDRQFDGVIALRGTSSARRPVRLLVEITPRPTPQTSRDYINIARSTHTPILLVAQWISPRTREFLDNHQVNYLDTTGNVSVRLDEPTIVLRSAGEQHNPEPTTQGRGLRGSRAGLLVRELVDVEPPRRPRELAHATTISEAYVSRLLEVMAAENLIQKEGRSIVEVDWQGLIRARAATYQLAKANLLTHALPRRGLEHTFDKLREQPTGGDAQPWALATGQFMASAIAPLAVGGPPLMLYVNPTSGPNAVDALTKKLGLLRTDHATDETIWLLLPPNSTAFTRPWNDTVDGVACVAPSQLALDCLTGPGRMPAQGEAVLEWMETHEQKWRHPSPLSVVR